MASFEEAIFRVYDRSIESIREENDQTASVTVKSCRFVELLVLGLGVFFFFVLIVLHGGYVGAKGCLPQLLHDKMVEDNRTQLLPRDAILQIKMDRRFFDEPVTLDDDVLATTGDERRRRRRLDHSNPPLFTRKTERWSEEARAAGSQDSNIGGILNTLVASKSSEGIMQQVRESGDLFETLLYTGRSHPSIVLRGMYWGINRLVDATHAVVYYTQRHSSAVVKKMGHAANPFSLRRGSASGGAAIGGVEPYAPTAPSGLLDETAQTHRLVLAQNKSSLPTNASHAHAGNSSSHGNSSHTELPHDGLPDRYFIKYDYEFSHDIGVLSLSDKIRARHNFTLVNVSVDGNQCFGNGLMRLLLPFGGVDTMVANNLMFTLPKGGMLMSSRDDYYIWRESDMKPYTNPGTWLGFKLQLLIKTLFSFFMMSCCTALLVRILISSGVVLLFPIFGALHMLGIVASDQHVRLISHAYPWLGAPMELLVSRSQSYTPFVMAHLSRVVVYYVLYEALQFSLALWVYDLQLPGQKELWLFAITMVWEYYSMIYVRSASTILFFPRASFLLFVLYHVYIYSFPSGFHMLALWTMFLFMMFMMIHCVRKYEYPAYGQGLVNSDAPRAYYNFLPYPQWHHALAPDFSLFMPMQHRSASIYGTMPPPPPPQAPGAVQAEEGAAAEVQNPLAPGDSRASSVASSVEMADLEGRSDHEMQMDRQSGSRDPVALEYEQLAGDSDHANARRGDEGN